MGPGPIGLQTAQIAKKVYGARKVILSGIRDERIERAGSYGLDGTINVRKENLKERVSEITEGKMIDIVIEMLEKGKIETKSMISHKMKLEDFEKGLDIMVNRKENAMKLILQP